jgi:PAS domain S-box-containing protein
MARGAQDRLRLSPCPLQPPWYALLSAPPVTFAHANAELYGWNQFRYPAARPCSIRIVTSRHTPALNRLRHRLRGVPPSALVQSLQDQLEAFDAAAIVADNAGVYVAANAKMCELTGYTRAELKRLKVRDLTPIIPYGSDGDGWSRFIHAGSKSGEFLLPRKDGTKIPVRYMAYASIAPGFHLSLLMVPDAAGVV